MKFAFYFGHPAQFLFARQTIKNLKNQGHETLILIKKKDVLESLLEASGLEYTNILPVERKNNKLSTMNSLIKRNRTMYPILKKYKPDLLISSDASFAHIGKIMSIPRITILEDDYDVIKPLAQITYPFSSTILCPNPCDVGKWKEKKFGYDGFMKLGYLHPEVFTPNKDILKKYNLNKSYAIIRLAQLSAYHDVGIKGISLSFLDRIISTLEKKGITPMISAESNIPDAYKPYILNIKPEDMHDVLAYSKILVCDSQSMSVEASMLGIPALRYSGLTGRISVLEELETKYKLTFGFQIGQKDALLQKLNEIIDTSGFSKMFKSRQSKMLDDKVNVTDFLTKYFVDYVSNPIKFKSNFINNLHQIEQQKKISPKPLSHGGSLGNPSKTLG